MVIVKDCNTRFGMAMTTGRAYVYANAEAMSVEPAYIHKRHEDLHGGSAEPLQKTTEVRLDGRQVAEGQGVQVRGRENGLEIKGEYCPEPHAAPAFSLPFTATANPAVAAATP